MESSHWWMEPGTETCGFCLRSYSWEAARRCARCDAQICPFCVRSGEPGGPALCPECSDEIG